MFCTVQRRHAFDDDSARSCAFDLRAHFIQKVREVHHLGFLRRPFNNGHAVGQHGRHHDVIGAQDGRAEFALHVDYSSF